jgi:predicted nucleic acid-binding protein
MLQIASRTARLCHDARAGDLYAAVKLHRQQRGLSLDENDLSVAATALALGATLVSRDNDFESIDGLPVVALV